MPKRLFDFVCVGEDSHTFEKFCDVELKTAVCPKCGELANRIISPVRCELDGCSGDFPGAAISWAKKRAEKLKQERKKSS